METYFRQLEKRQYSKQEVGTSQLAWAMTDIVWESWVFPQPSNVIRGMVASIRSIITYGTRHTPVDPTVSSTRYVLNPSHLADTHTLETSDSE